MRHLLAGLYNKAITIRDERRISALPAKAIGGRWKMLAQSEISLDIPCSYGML